MPFMSLSQYWHPRYANVALSRRCRPKSIISIWKCSRLIAMGVFVQSLTDQQDAQQQFGIDGRRPVSL